MAGGFSMNTRRKIVQLPSVSKPTGGGTVSFTLPKTGLAGRLYLAIRATIAGSTSAPNALGTSAILTRCRVTANSGIDLFNVSGPGYAYLLQELLESEYFLASGQNQGRSAITGSGQTANLDMVIPFAMNSRDPIGMIMLQNEQTVITCTLDFAADGSVATGATVTCTVTPYLELFTVPVDPADWPPLNLVHQILEETQAVAATGQFTYYWPRGNTYLQVAHALGIGASGADGFTQAQLRVNQSDYLQSTDVNFLDIEQRFLRGRARPAGALFFDLMATSGLGNYGSTRDFFNSALVTDLATVITASATGNFYALRRQLVMLG